MPRVEPARERLFGLGLDHHVLRRQQVYVERAADEVLRLAGAVLGLPACAERGVEGI